MDPFALFIIGASVIVVLAVISRVVGAAVRRRSHGDLPAGQATPDQTSFLLGSFDAGTHGGHHHHDGGASHSHGDMGGGGFSGGGGHHG